MSIPAFTSPPRRSGRRAVLLLAAVFVAGAIAGAAVERLVATRAAAASPLAGVAYAPKIGGDGVGPAAQDIPYAVRQLDLTDDERAKVRAIVQRVRPQSDTLWLQVRTEILPKSRALETRMFQDILCVLTPAQRETWRRQMTEQAFDTAVVNERLRPALEGRCPAAP